LLKTSDYGMKLFIAIGFAILCPYVWTAGQIPTNGLLGYYPFNGNANDESGNGNNATFYAVTLTTDRCGIANSAFYFGGVNNYIMLPSEDLIHLDEYTYSLWFRADSLPHAALDSWVLLAVGSESDNIEQVFSIHSDATLTGKSFNIGDNPSVTTIRTAPIQTDNWHHGVFTRDNTRLKIFIDGVQMVNISNLDSLIHGQPANYGTDPQTATIGGRSDLASKRYFVGAIDEVRIYNHALSLEEIRQLFYTECTLSQVFGPTEVCQGQKNLSFYVNPQNNAVYDWKYSGTGTTIHNDGNNNITIDFSESATSGMLTVTVSGNNMDVQTRSIAIHVNSLPSAAGPIDGPDAVCQGDTGLNFSVPAIDNAKTYQWSYSGDGEELYGSGNTASVDFSAIATSGNLVVSGFNACGEGPPSPDFPITVIPLPSGAGTINGEPVVCRGQQGISYSVPAISDASGYTWTFSGTGYTISAGDSNYISMDFDPAATSGNLTVMGINGCGNGQVSDAFPITITSLPDETGTIAGDNEVCSDQSDVAYSVTSIPLVTSYLWEYSATGVTIQGNSNSILIDFTGESASGNLTVAGSNICGVGPRSGDFLITVVDCSENPLEINIPNSFSPNGDGINDVFVITNLPQNTSLLIFDRSGRKRYESSDYQNDWDGKDQNGKGLETDTYWYVVTDEGTGSVYKGFVYLKR
jgi:gliding motility-associated-like protein